MKVIAAACLLLITASAPVFAGEGDDEHERAISSCKSLYSKKRVAFAHCVNIANGEWWHNNAPENFDLFRLAAARETVLAERFDAGKLTEAEYRAGREKIRSDLISSAKSRDAMRAAQNPVYIAPQPRPFTCYTYGSGRLTQCF